MEIALSAQQALRYGVEEGLAGLAAIAAAEGQNSAPPRSWAPPVRSATGSFNTPPSSIDSSATISRLHDQGSVPTAGNKHNGKARA